MKVDQPAMLVGGPEQVLPVATDRHILSSTRHEVARYPWYQRTRFSSMHVAMNPAHDRGRIHVYAAFLHHLRQIPVAIPDLQYQRTHTRMISTGKRRRLNRNKAPRRTTPDYDTPVNATELRELPQRIPRCTPVIPIVHLDHLFI
jgi:hypothetical protein